MHQRATHAPRETLDPKLLADVIAVAPAPLWVIGDDGTVQLANDAAITVLGYASVGDVIGAPSHDLLHPVRPDGSAYPSHTCPILRGAGSGASGPEWFIKRSGRPIAVRWSTRTLDATGTRLLSFDDSPVPSTDEASGVQRLADAVDVPSRAALGDAVLRHIRERFDDPTFSVGVLAAELHLSVRSVQVVLAERALSPAAEIRRARLELARELLGRGSPVRFAAHESGFSDAGTFTRAFRRQYGRSPSAVERNSRPGPPASPSPVC